MTLGFLNQTSLFPSTLSSQHSHITPTTSKPSRLRHAPNHRVTMKFPWQSEPLNKPVKVKAGTASSSQLGGVAQDIAANDAVAISGQLKGAIQRMYATHLTENGVDYKGMGASEAFQEYLVAASRLPDLDVDAALTDDVSKIAFYVNLYNATTQHGIVARGAPPNSSLGRVQWGMKNYYQVGKYKLSLHEMENGILRKNKKISVIPAPFKSSDPRLKLCVDKPDPRIHFVLNCGANSCPPVLFLTPENLEYTLDIATKGFLSNKDNFCVKDYDVYLSQIFKWYREDFMGSSSGSDLDIIKFIKANGDAENEDIKQLDRIMANKFSIKWLDYDWGLNDA